MSTDESHPLAAHVRALEDEEHFSGIFRATRGDEVILEWCHGFANRADRIPVRPTTRFATASLSKMFTAVGVLDAAGRGADVLTPRTPSWDDWHLGYGVDLRPDGVWGKDGGDPGVLVIARYRPATDTTAVFLANVDDDGVEDLDTLAFNLVNTALDT